MKSILFLLPSFDVGGTTVSVKNLLLTLPKDKYRCHVLALYPFGKLHDLYNDESIISSDLVLNSLFSASWKLEDKKWKWLAAMTLRVFSRKIKLFKKFLFRKEAAKLLQQYDFDTIVACQEGLATEFGSYFNNKNQIAFVRCDYSKYLKGANIATEYAIYDTYKNIICVSDEMRKIFVDTYPGFNSRTKRIFNAQSPEFIEKMAEASEDFKFSDRCFNIVSIGRFAPIKRFSYIPIVAKKLRGYGIEFKWYIIGDGSERERIEKMIVENEVTDFVECIGIKSNPFYYIKKADLVVCLSESEACPRIINEAKILHTLIVCTDFTSAHEYIESGKNGVICSIEEVDKWIYKILTDKILNQSIKEEITQFRFDNKEILASLGQIL